MLLKSSLVEKIATYKNIFSFSDQLTINKIPQSAPYLSFVFNKVNFKQNYS